MSRINPSDPAVVRRRQRRTVLAEWRGMWKPPDLSGYERKVGDVVNRVLGRAGLDERLLQEEVAAAWQSIVGEFIARQSSPLALRRGVLQVAVRQAALRYDLDRRWKRDILERLQQRCGPDKITGVRFVAG